MSRTRVVKEILSKTLLTREKTLEKIIPRKCNRGLCGCVQRIENNRSDMLHELFYSDWESCYRASLKYTKPRTDGKIEWTKIKE